MRGGGGGGGMGKRENNESVQSILCTLICIAFIGFEDIQLIDMARRNEIVKEISIETQPNELFDHLNSTT